jgi:murein DD-endopeptidase MepM/ murein hydrolase activator NlpD
VANKTVTVKKGDTLSAIAKANKTTVAKIVAANPKITNPNLIRVNQKIVVPVGTGTKSTSTAAAEAAAKEARYIANFSNPVTSQYDPRIYKDTSSDQVTTTTNTSKVTNEPKPDPVYVPGSTITVDPATLNTASSQTRDTFSLAQLQSRFSIAAAVIGADKSLQDALNRILGVNGEPMVEDPYLQEQIIKSTSWWKSQTDTQRQFDWAKETNPGQFAADLQLNASEIVKKFAANGLNITAQDAIKYAEQMMKQAIIQDGKVIRFDADYINKLMANAIDFTKNDKIGGRVVYTKLSGNLETLAQSLYKQAWDYGYPQTMSNGGFTNWFETSIKGLVGGTLNPQQIDDQLQARAKSFAPGLANLIDQGQTLRQAADPWLQAMADVWEVGSVNEIDLNDEYVQRALNSTNEKGVVAPINLYDAKKLARRSSKWDMTQNAKEEKTRIAGRILQDFGFMG